MGTTVSFERDGLVVELHYDDIDLRPGEAMLDGTRVSISTNPPANTIVAIRNALAPATEALRRCPGPRYGALLRAASRSPESFLRSEQFGRYCATFTHAEWETFDASFVPNVTMYVLGQWAAARGPDDGAGDIATAVATAFRTALATSTKIEIDERPVTTMTFVRCPSFAAELMHAVPTAVFVAQDGDFSIFALPLVRPDDRFGTYCYDPLGADINALIALRHETVSALDRAMSFRTENVIKFDSSFRPVQRTIQSALRDGAPWRAARRLVDSSPGGRIATLLLRAESCTDHAARRPLIEQVAAILESVPGLVEPVPDTSPTVVPGMYSEYRVKNSALSSVLSPAVTVLDALVSRGNTTTRSLVQASVSTVLARGHDQGLRGLSERFMDNELIAFGVAYVPTVTANGGVPIAFVLCPVTGKFMVYFGVWNVDPRVVFCDCQDSYIGFRRPVLVSADAVPALVSGGFVERPVVLPGGSDSNSDRLLRAFVPSSVKSGTLLMTDGPSISIVHDAVSVLGASSMSRLSAAIGVSVDGTFVTAHATLNALSKIESGSAAPIIRRGAYHSSRGVVRAWGDFPPGAVTVGIENELLSRCSPSTLPVNSAVTRLRETYGPRFVAAESDGSLDGERGAEFVFGWSSLDNWQRVIPDVCKTLHTSGLVGDHYVGSAAYGLHVNVQAPSGFRWREFVARFYTDPEMLTLYLALARRQSNSYAECPQRTYPSASSIPSKFFSNRYAAINYEFGPVSRLLSFRLFRATTKAPILAQAIEFGHACVMFIPDGIAKAESFRDFVLDSDAYPSLRSFLLSEVSDCEIAGA
jgi:hypothetical protein